MITPFFRLLKQNALEPSLTSISLSHCISNPSTNAVSSTVKTNPESNHFPHRHHFLPAPSLHHLPAGLCFWLCRAACGILVPSACVLGCFHPVRLFATPWAVARQAPLSVGFSRQECWSGLSCPPPGDLPHPGIKPTSHLLPWEAGSLPLAPSGKLLTWTLLIDP